MAKPHDHSLKTSILSNSNQGNGKESNISKHQTYSTSPSSPSPEGTDGGHDGSLHIADEHESFVATYTRRNKLISSSLFRTITILCISAIVFGGWYMNIKERRRILGLKISTDREGMLKTLQDTKDVVERVNSEWLNASKVVREAYIEFYSPTSINPKTEHHWFPSMITNIIKKLQDIPVPEDTAQNTDKILYSLKNMLAYSIVSAVEIRLKQLKELEKFSNERPSCPIRLLNKNVPHTPLKDDDLKEGSSSFAQFTRDLEARGYKGISRTGDSGPQVPNTLVDRLTDIVLVKHITEIADKHILENFQKIIATIEQAKIGRDIGFREVLDNISLDSGERPFPIPRFHRHILRTEARLNEQQLKPIQIYDWRNKWSPIGVQSIILTQRNLQGEAVALEKDMKVAALHGWRNSLQIKPHTPHPFEIAVALV